LRSGAKSGDICAAGFTQLVKIKSMDIYNFLLGLLIFVCSFLLIVRELTRKRPVDMSAIQVVLGLLFLFMIGIYLMYTEFKK
jgi:uncharacterized membrane protein